MDFEIFIYWIFFSQGAALILIVLEGYSISFQTVKNLLGPRHGQPYGTRPRIPEIVHVGEKKIQA